MNGRCPLRLSLARSACERSTGPFAFRPHASYSHLPPCKRATARAGEETSTPGAKLADGLFAVGGGLIDVGHFAQGPVEHLGGEMVRHFPGVEADPVLIIPLVVEKVAHGADLASKTQAAAQYPCPGKGAAIAELGKFQCV